jgi:hypothetical protein
MTLRLVLVGMVAALGVSIPSRPSSENWFDSAEAWATSMLAQWDSWEPAEDDAAVPAEKRDHLSCEECRLARLKLATNALRASQGDPPAPKPVTFEPIRVSEPFETGIAYELNRQSEGLGIAGTSPETITATTVSEPPLPADAFEIGALDELDQDIIIEAENPAVSTQSEVTKLSAADGSDESAVSGLDEQWIEIGCLDEAEAHSDEVPAFADLPRKVFAPAEPRAALIAQNPAAVPAIGVLAYLAKANLTQQVAPVSAHFKQVPGKIPAFGTLVYLSGTDGSAVVPTSSPNTSAIEAAEPAVPVNLADLPRKVFTPAIGFNAPAPLQADHSLAGTHSQPARLGDAVELTRRAVSAWVSVLIGPALVDVSRR